MKKIVLDAGAASVHGRGCYRARFLPTLRPAMALSVVLLTVWLGGITEEMLAYSADRSDRPNIILILADDLGYGDLGCYGQSVLKTPHLDSLASAGVRFTQFYAGCTVCAPSRSVLLTGQHTGHTPVRGNSLQPIVLPSGYPTIASMLQSAGYATGCIGKWGVGTPHDLTNPHQVGFDHFFGYVDMWHAHNFYPEFLIRNAMVVRLENEVAKKWKPFQQPGQPQHGRGVAQKRVQYAPDLLADAAIEFVKRHRDRPFFLYYAMNVPHANNEAGSDGMEVPTWGEYATRPWPDAEKGFAAMISNIDRDCHRLVETVRQLGLAEQTLILFTSDNGPHHEGGHDADFFDSNGPLTGYKRDLTEGGIRVPMIACWPNHIAPGGEATGPWYFGDFFRTFASITGAPLPNNHELDSEDFSSVLLDGRLDATRTTPIYWEFHERGTAQAVRFGRWKAIRQPMFDGPVRLFDLESDVGEARDVAAQHPEIVRRAVEILDREHRMDPNWPVRGEAE
ncbi:MAG: N-acetylgalactosamine-6-sulfatase [Pirellulaceae bacterium]|nr:MAG: N-acetylgalactosamine-6-sulfatase [Pirellulaceae bacterium]